MSRLKDLSGSRFGKWTVLQLVQTKPTLWECRCECGSKKKIHSSNLIRGMTTRCRECRATNLFGKRFGRLVALEAVARFKAKRSWKCLCDCGNERIVTTSGLLRKGITECRPCSNKRMGENKTVKIKAGEKFGKWTAICPSQKGDRPHWKCQCECGATLNIRNTNLKNLRTLQCQKCLAKENSKKLPKVASEKKRRVNFLGKKIGKWTVLRYLKTTSCCVWECRCDCGTVAAVPSHILRKDRSWGCQKCHEERTLLHARILGDKRKLGIDVAASNLVFLAYRNGARARRLEFQLSKDHVKALIKQNCKYCGRPPMRHKKIQYYSETFVYNGIDRVNNLLGYTVENCVPCCTSCNFRKGAVSLEMCKKILSLAQNSQ